MVKLNQEAINLAFNCCLLELELEFLHGTIPSTKNMFDNGTFVVIEVTGCNDNDRIAVNIHFVGKRCQLKTMAEWLGFDLNQSDFEASPAPQIR